MLKLNPKQIEAVEYDKGPLLVLAGAGSGKTRVLTQRIIHCIRNKSVSPWQIFAVTFTNKAAREMKNRIVADLGPSAESLWISTFHSSCLRILRTHAERIGYQPQFVIYDTSEQVALMKSIIVKMELNDKFYKPKMILAHIDRAKNTGQGPEEFVTEGDTFLQKVQDIYRNYQKGLQNNQAMDFGDLILHVLTLFKNHPDILAHYQNQFHYLFIDEYQDTNPVQYQLIRFLAEKNRHLFVVGDDDQSIYKFRGADIAIILNFKKDYPEAEIVRLEQNYRSTQNILTASNAIIRENRDRLGKELWTENESGEKITITSCTNEKNEARFVVEEILQKREEFLLKDFAIFYRTNAQSRSLEDELRRHNLPYKIFGGMKFYDRAEIKDVLSYLRLLFNRQDDLGLKRIINMPARGIGKTTIQKLETGAAQNQVCLWDVLATLDHPRWNLNLSDAVCKKLKSFVALIEKLNLSLKEMSLGEFLTHLYEETGYWQMLSAEKSIEAEGRKENLMELVNVVEEIVETNEGVTLATFLDQVSLASDLDQLEETDDYVTLMTVHLSKGLEFPVVFLTGLEEGLFPHARSLDTEAEMEEERRLCYVGMTRAKKFLFMTQANERRVFGVPQYHFPSRFLSNLPEEIVEYRLEKTVSNDVPNGWLEKASPPSIDYSYTQDEVPLQKGQPVSHAVFGKGVIQMFEGSGEQLKVTVRFQKGFTKKLLFKHANLHVD